MPNCAECVNKPCWKGESEGFPKNCPTIENDKEKIFGLYSEEDIKAEHESALVEAEGYCKNTRLEETMDYAYKMGYKHLGLAFCVGLSEEAKTFCKILRSNGFIVDSVCCKNCQLSKANIGIKKEEQVNKESDFEPMCNPIGQAYVLDEAKVDLAILLGLCVGHDSLFIKSIKAPCTVFASKDRAMGHNPMGAIYTAEGYMHRQYDFLKNKYGENPWESK